MLAQGSAGQQEQIRTKQCLAPVSRGDRRLCISVFAYLEVYIHGHECQANILVIFELFFFWGRLIGQPTSIMWGKMSFLLNDLKSNESKLYIQHTSHLVKYPLNE